jgi:hypothetical protein
MHGPEMPNKKTFYAAQGQTLPEKKTFTISLAHTTYIDSTSKIWLD